MAGRLRHLGRLLGVGEVEEAASCARALAALPGERSVAGIVSEAGSQLTRALLTARVMEALGPVPWPSALRRQLDPDDPAFLPPLGIHLVLSARDSTVLALPGRDRQAWVDPLAWAGFGDGPAVAVWFGDGQQGWPVGPPPGPAAQDGGAAVVSQSRSDDGHGLVTLCARGPFRLEVFHWPVVLQGQVACALYARLSLEPSSPPRPARLAFALRPVGLEGVEPVFRLDRDAEGLWRANGASLLALARPGEEILLGSRDLPDPWRAFSSPASTSASDAAVPGRQAAGPVSLACPAGMASGAEVYHTLLSPGEPFSCFAVIAPPPEAPASLVRTSGRALWRGSIADRKGTLAAGAEIHLLRHDLLLDAARSRALIGAGPPELATCLAVVALARLGFVRKAGQRLSQWMGRVQRSGRLLGAEGATPALLAWTAAEYTRWTGDRNWVRDHLTPWRRLLDHIKDRPLPPGGRPLFGADGSARWTALWRCAALLHSSSALREIEAEHQTWALAGGAAREALPGVLGPAPWSPAPGRTADGASAGLLAAAWLGLIPADHPDVQQTIAHIRAHHWHGGGVFSQGGAHPAGTALLLAVQQRTLPRASPDALDTVAALASPTGAFPSARHPQRGALGTGDDLLGAALFLLLALDAVRIAPRTLHITPGIRRAVDLPTPFGRIDIDGDKVVGRWRGAPPRVLIDPQGGGG